jgi:hypothetical protein
MTYLGIVSREIQENWRQMLLFSFCFCYNYGGRSGMASGTASKADGDLKHGVGIETSSLCKKRMKREQRFTAKV